MNHKDHEEHEGLGSALEAVGRQIVDAGIKVHSQLGPGLLESTYEHCLIYELSLRGVRSQRQVPLPIRYGEVELDAGYRLDLLVEDDVIVEIKAVEALTRSMKRSF